MFFFTLPALPYVWRQTLVDLDVSVQVPKGTRSKDLVVDIKKKSLTVGFKGQEPIIKVSTCTFNLLFSI